MSVNYSYFMANCFNQMLSSEHSLTQLMLGNFIQRQNVKRCVYEYVYVILENGLFGGSLPYLHLLKSWRVFKFYLPSAYDWMPNPGDGHSE